MSTGRWFFAWIDEEEEFDPEVHARTDERVLELRIEEAEGAAATAVVIVPNSGQGLLRPGAKRWALISCELGGTPTLVFRGSVTGAPLLSAEETIELELVARPSDWEAQQASLLEGLKDGPEWSDYLVDSRDRNEPDEILAGHAALLHWGRATHVLSLSSIVDGPLIAFDWHDRASVSAELEENPVGAVELVLEAQWTQEFDVWYELGDTIKQAILDQAVRPGGGEALFKTALRGELESSWASLEEIQGVGSLEIVSAYLEVSDTQLVSYTGSGSVYDFTDDPLDPNIKVTTFLWTLEPVLNIAVDYSQARVERLSATLPVRLQPVLADGGATETIAIRLQDVTPLLATPGDDGAAWTEVRAQSFWLDGNGDLAAWAQPIVTAGLCRAKARLLRAARCVRIEANVPLADALTLGLDCTRRAQITDDRFGGSVVGKVSRCELVVDGRLGVEYATVTLSCSVGLAEEATEGLPAITLAIGQEPTAGLDGSKVGDPAYFVEDLVCQNFAWDQSIHIWDEPDNVWHSEINWAPHIEIQFRDCTTSDVLERDVALDVAALDAPAQVDLGGLS